MENDLINKFDADRYALQNYCVFTTIPMVGMVPWRIKHLKTKEILHIKGKCTVVHY